MVTKKGEVEIRMMTRADLPQIREIDRLLTGRERAPSWLESAAEVWFVRRPQLNFVAELGGQVVGFILGDIKVAEYGTPMSGWIDMIGVHPDFQRQRIGRRLVETFCEGCQRLKIKVRVVIREDDKRLTRFWTSLGFQKGKLVDFER